MRLIVTSNRDIAGSNIYRHLSKNFGFTQTGEFEENPIFKKGDILLIATEKGQVEAEHLDDFFLPDYYVVASRHRSVSGERTLTVHAPGNLSNEAKVGGRPRELAISAPDAMRTALLKLEKERIEKNLDYKVSLEVTHHGPTTLNKPVLFVEVGSTEKEWKDPLAIDAVSKAALAAAENNVVFKKGIGIGGNHYAPRHTQFILNAPDALGHLVPSYALGSFDISMFKQAVEKSSATFCFLDWKGMDKDQRGRVLKLSQEMGIKVKKSISKGHDDAPEGFTKFKVNRDLFSLAEKVDPGRLKDTITKNNGLPFEKNGHIQPEFLAQRDIKNEILKACISILRQKKPVLSDRTLSYEEKKFDPKLAERLGISPGPDFAHLKNGGDVMVEGRRIRHDDVVVTKQLELNLDDETVRILKSFI